jgi:SOS response regulatory protein OraA/RecX
LAQSFITPDNVFRTYEASKTYTNTLTEPFPEFARIARNRPFEGIDPAYPKTTDGTTASIIQKSPKRVVQQLPTGRVESDDDNAWLPIVAGFIYTNKILPYANEDYGLFEKSHLAIEGGLTFGSTCTFTPFLNHDGYFCPDLTIPYWGDIFLQKGKKSGYACNYIFMRAWWQKEDLKSLIADENKRTANGEYESTWDTAALAEVLEAETTKDQQAMTPTEQERGVDTSAIELVTAFQKGVGAKFYTFVPGAKKIVRTKVNKDPRGKMPLDWFYGDIDGTNPLGRGIVELIGGLQNLIDSDMQMYQYNRALMLAPPVIKRGNIGNFKFAPNAVIDASNDPTADIIPLKIDTSAVVNYPQLYGLQKSQLLNLVGSPDTSISAEVGNPGFGKTPTALNQQKAAISVDDNAIRKRFESWFENWSETAINLYFAERSGKEILQLDADTADELRKLVEKQKLDEGFVNDDNQIILDYDEATPILKFRVDASTSKMQDDATQLQALVGLLETLEQNQLLQSVVPPVKIAGAWNAIVSASGIEDPEILSIDLKELEQKLQQQEQMAQQQAQMQAQAPQPQTPAQPQDDIEPQIAQQMQQLGFSPQAIDQAISMSRQGANEQQIAQALGVTNG